ncbi:ADP-ribose pyrophosphatase YjhB (NUDIX family) [Paenibacillus cellulosilyticus]|uniref:ADP-ribose pyrophosphatase YjhB (NUDIX family) n=1 Tax=Paenibacillus cellulosilyticus TaxID=375489 RepID=A0A2V2YQ23_9BACL|nr:NUDIX hydrolase [Paenibacillus cellulosilyticus]PWV98368.1 ADP-ribose pyrophosphatase YjhB (NUDIX family) [Paenibacillus cellulosilyticus]QKS43220.1 NUDIX hydrolase [Paenibacillus cellulosilyticus]
MRIACSAGGFIVNDNKVLLVQITYGANKGYWMLPGGFVEEGESFEEAAIREVKEETGLYAIPTRLIGVRTGFKERPDELEHGIYFIFEMEVLSGELVADGSEISEVKYVPIPDVLAHPQVVGLTKEIVRSYQHASQSSGLSRTASEIQTNNKYAKYKVYSLME